MAATKSAKKKSSAPRNAASKKTKKSRKPTDVEIVRASAANPAESRAGTRHPIAIDLDGVSVETVDGARAEVEVKKQLLDQAGLHTLIKALSQASQETY